MDPGDPLGYNDRVKLSYPEPPEPCRDAPVLTAVDLFAGAGGLSYAFHTCGYEVRAAVEIDDKAIATYRESFVAACSPTTQALCADVRDDKTIKLLRQAIGARRLDVLIGGPPCQDFSPARLKREKVKGRASLVLRYIEILGLLKPRAFLFENVPGLLTADGGKHWQNLRGALGDKGYVVSTGELDAQDFRVPQRRRRLFVVGVHQDEGSTFEFPPGDSNSPLTVGEVFARHADVLPDVAPGKHPAGDKNHKARNHRPETVSLLELIRPGESWRHARDRGGRVLRCHEGHNGHYDVYGRIDPDAVAPTMTGGCTNPSKGRFIHPQYHRGLTVREAALLQTFPPGWRFLGGIERESRQVGNAVPIKLGQALANAMRQALGTSAVWPEQTGRYAEEVGADA